MKTLPLRFLPIILILLITENLTSFFSLYGKDTEIEEVKNRAVSAAETIESRLSKLEDRDFFTKAANRRKSYGSYPTSPASTYIQCLRNDLRIAFAEIELAKHYPGINLDEAQLVEILIGGGRSDFSGTEGHLKDEVFREYSRLLEKFILDDELNFADRLFCLLKKKEDDHAGTLEKWIDQMSFLVSDGMLGTKGKLSVSQQAKCVRALQLFGFVLKSRHVNEAASLSPETNSKLEKFLSIELTDALRTYCRRRFVEDGPLRDRCLPLISAANYFLPELTHRSAGITTHQNYQKLALAHARGLASLVEIIDSPMADTQLARKSIGQIIDYKFQPFYLGSTGIREKGTLPCAPGDELEVILNHARFFGKRGHIKGEEYRRRVKVLENLFLRPSSEETLDFLFALKKPDEWLQYFRERLLGENKEPDSCLAALAGGKIEPVHLKRLFLARCILSHSAYETTAELREGRDAIKTRLRDAAPELAVNLYKAMPDRWNQVDLAFVEISRLVPEFDLESLSIPTYEDYRNQREDYEWAMKSLPRDFLSLADSDSPDLLDNEVGLFQSDYVYRTGKFHKALNPEFIKKINGKLKVIHSYRESQFTPPDLSRRDGLEKNGAIRELTVVNRHYPEIENGNPQLHDLLEGPDGGFGGLGEFILCDPRGYESRETAMDAIASCNDLKLGDALFTLAMDVGIKSPTDADKAAAARRWLNYFRRTQSIARFHSTPNQLRNAIRGAFACRLVVQSDLFIDAVERSPRVAVGSMEDVSTVLEKTVSSQVRIMNSILSSVDPSTALNKDIDHIKSRWYDLKAWHTESSKWLESVVADPTLMSEVSRIRSLSRDQTDSYSEIAPPVIDRVEETLSAVEPRIAAERHSSRHDELFKPLDFANLVMGQLVTLQKKPMGRTSVDPEAELSPAGSRSKEALADEITRHLFLDIRNAVSEAGFDELSKVNSLTEFPAITRAYYENAGFRERGEEAAIHELLLHQLKGAVAKAKGRIEAERVTDLSLLEDLTIRAARADRIFFAGDPERYSLLIDPSFLLHEWNNRHKIETIAEFRTVETRAQAQTQIFRFRKEREKLEAVRAEMEKQQEEMETRLSLARKWAEENNYDFDPEAVVDQMIAMEDKIKALEGDIVNYQSMEEKYRKHHMFLASELHSYKMGEKFNRDKGREILLARADLGPLPEPDPEVVAIIEKPPPPPKKIIRPQTTYRRPTSSSRSSSSRSGGFFSRIFRRNR